MDVHTHTVPLVAGSAIVNCYPETFVPEAGGRYSVGTHPWYVNEADEARKELLRQCVRHPQVVAVGEAGLDKLCATPLPLQEELFAWQARLAEEVGKPLIIHLVRATADLLRIRRTVRPTVPWVIHGFRGKEQQAEELLRHGFYLSYGEHYHEESLRHTPLDRLLLETDESLVPIEELYHRAAAVRGMDTDTFRRAVEGNAARLFGL